MKHLLLTTIAAVLLVGCGKSQQSVPAPEAKPVEPVVEAAQPKPPTTKAPNISIHEAFKAGNIEAVKQHLAAGTDVNAKGPNAGLTPLHRAAYYGLKEIVELLLDKGADVNAKEEVGWTPLHYAAAMSHKAIAELLLDKGADVNAKDDGGDTPLDVAMLGNDKETAELIRKHGGKTGEKLKAEGE